jgi:hypothetical protein
MGKRPEDDRFCGCEEHETLAGLALVLHQQEIGCSWTDRVPNFNEMHYRPVEIAGEAAPGLVELVYDAGPYPHDGALHQGNHQVVADAIRSAVREENPPE